MSDHTRTSRSLRPVNAEGSASPDPVDLPSSERILAEQPERLFQSARADYSIKWTETGLVAAPPLEAEGDWPSDRWRKHLATCGPASECRHRVPEPEWWVLMSGRGTPLHADATEARALANKIINGFRSKPVLPEPYLTFAQDVLRDAMIVAPQPVTASWVNSGLSAVALLVRSVAVDGGPLTREHVFSQRVRDRLFYVHMSDHAPSTADCYRSRLELIAMALDGVTVRDPNAHPVGGGIAPQDPLTPQQEAALYPWAIALQPKQRRQRLTALVVLGLGLGPTTPNLLRLTREDFTIDDAGVHAVLVDDDGTSRIVTCRREWEQRLVELLKVTPPKHYAMSPWRDTPVVDGGYQITLARAQKRFTPPVYFNAGRLRNTWLVRQMESGVPMRTLTEAAGLESPTSIVRLVSFCERQMPEAASASLRGAVR